MSRWKPPSGLYAVCLVLFLAGFAWTGQLLEAAGAGDTAADVGAPIWTASVGHGGSQVMIGRLASFQPARGELSASDWPVFLPVAGGTLAAALLGVWLARARRRAQRIIR